MPARALAVVILVQSAAQCCERFKRPLKGRKMTRSLLAAGLGVVLIALPTPNSTLAQQTPGAQPSSTPAYRPGLGDLMTMTIQPRHLKLGIAGKEKNWAYAVYEHHQLEEALERVSRYWPQW